MSPATSPRSRSPRWCSGINAFTLAARRVNPEFQTNVVWVSSWYDPAKEADAAKALFDQGADVISQHTDSPAALQAAEQRGLMAFGQAWDMSSFAPTAHLTAIENHWGVYVIEPHPGGDGRRPGRPPTPGGA